MLLAFPLPGLVDVAASSLFTKAGLEGAARLFAGTAFQTHGQERAVEGPVSIGYNAFDVFQPIRSGKPVQLPEALRRQLWDHCQRSDDPDKRQRGESAFRET